MKERYESVPYLAGAHAESHPRRLAAFARLHGLNPPDPATSRVLELGCGRGGNLIPIAVDYPAATCVGMDLAEGHVAAGNALVADLDLPGCALYAGDLLDWQPPHAAYDYVIVHGVYTWVPAPVQRAVLALIGRVLSADGVAYVSYNCLPGWRMRETARDLMRFHVGGEGDPLDQVEAAKALMGLYAEAWEGSEGAYGDLLRREGKLTREGNPWYVFHDQLAEVNGALYFGEFVARAATHGLRYLAEADGRLQLPRNNPEALRRIEALSDDVVRQEQYLDFLGNRQFRCTLLCRDTAAPSPRPSPDAVRSLFVAGLVRPEQPANLGDDEEVPYRTHDGKNFRVSAPILKAALAVLFDRHPAGTAFDDLYSEALTRSGLADPDGTERAYLAESLLYAFEFGLVELDADGGACVSTASARPASSALARAQLRAGYPWVTNGRHENVKLPPVDQRFLMALDGRPVDDVVATLVDDALAGRLDVHRADGAPITDRDVLTEALAAGLDARLEILARRALLVR